MATVGFQAVGTSIGGPIGGAIGAAIGNYVDQKYIFPALFPQDDIQGNRLDSLQLSYGSEGAPMNRTFGSKVKCAATCIWLSDIRETSDEQEVGKGGGQSIETITYKLDMAWAVCETSHLSTGAIDGVEKLWFDGNLAWVEDPNLTSGTQTNLTITVGTQPSFAGGVGVIVNTMVISSPVGGYNLGTFLSGRDATTSGFTNGANNGSFRVISAVTNGDGSSTLELENPDVIAEAAGASAIITQIGPQFDPDLATGFTFYLGDQTTEDPTIVANEADVPQFRHTAYFVVNNFNMSQYGGRPPTSIEAQIRTESGTVTRATVIGQILDSANLPSGVSYNTSNVSGNVQGMVLRGPTAPINALTQMMAAFDILDQDRDGVLYFIDRASLDEVTIASGDLAARELGGESRANDLRFRDNRHRDLPQRIDVTYIEAENELQNGSQSYTKRDASTAGSSVSLRLDIVLTGVEAQCIAQRTLWQMHVGGVGLAADLPPSYLKAIENDILKVTGDDNVERDLLVRTLDIGANHLRQYEGDENDAQTVNFDTADCTVEDPDITPQIVGAPPNLALHALDIAPLTDGEVTQPGFYWCISPYDSGPYFSGGSLFESKDDGSSFTFSRSSAVRATMGLATTALADVTDPNVVDRGNTVTVEIYSGSVSSKTEAEMLAGANRAILGDEIIAFSSVTDNGDGTFDLGGLLRGLRDTEDETGGHTVGERFVFLSGPGMNFNKLSVAAFGDTRDYRAVPSGGVISSYSTQVDDITLALNVLRPFRPYKVEATIVSDDWTITWERRTRAIYNALSGNPLPQIEPQLLYEVDVMNGSTVVRTISTTVESASYIEADQITDFGSAQTTLTLRVYQISSVVGRSKVQEVTLTP